MTRRHVVLLLAALAVVRAMGEGWLELDRPLAGIIPEWKADEGKRRVTVRMKLTKKLRTVLKRKRRLALRMAAKVRDPLGNTRSVKKVLRPRLARKRRR